jgi:uncharacterized protein YdeI (YjbR/CyaY-like superfamily)
MTPVAVDIKSGLRGADLWEEFSSLSPSHQKEYLQWIEDAKRPETRANRIAKMCEMIASKKTSR